MFLAVDLFGCKGREAAAGSIGIKFFTSNPSSHHVPSGVCSLHLDFLLHRHHPAKLHTLNI